MQAKLGPFSIFVQVGTQKEDKYLKGTNADYQLIMTKNNLTKFQKNNEVCEVGTCPVTTSLSVFGGKWKASIINILHLWGTHRFGELRKLIPGVTQKMLTQHLRQLEADGLVRREIFAEVPPRVEYSLTEYGQTLSPVLSAMADWGQLHIERTKV